MQFHTATVQEYAIDGGSGRIGTYYRQSNVYAYEMRDQLGNVRSVIAKSSNGLEVRMYNDYYPYGMTVRSGGTNYRYGYQGAYAEKDGETDWNAFELRMYDSRIARWMSYDPAGQYASPYVAMGNDPANSVDPDGGQDNGGPIHNLLPVTVTGSRSLPRTANISQLDGLIIPVKALPISVPTYLDRTVLKFDPYVNFNRIGKESIVKDNMAISRQNYYSQVGEAIASNPFGAAGYYGYGAPGAIYGSAAGMVGMSFGSLASEGFLSKPSSNLELENISLTDGIIIEARPINLQGGAARAAKFSNKWPNASLNNAIKKFGANSIGISTNTGKILYKNNATGIQIVFDNAGNYFRIENTNLNGRRVYLDLNGNIPNNKIVNGKNIGRSQSEYNQVTHFNNF